MRPLITTATLLLLPTSITALTLNCADSVRVNSTTFDLSALGGPRTVHDVRYQGDYLINTTYTIDICKPLKVPKGEPKEHTCSTGTRVCGIEWDHEHEAGGWKFRDVVEIAGEYTTSKGKGLEPSYELIQGKETEGEGGKPREGVKVRLNGGSHGKERTPQAAIVDFICDEKLEGTEGFENEPEFEKAVDAREYGAMGRRSAAEEGDDGDGKKEGNEDEGKLPDMDKGKSLQFVSYELEGDTFFLQLEWRTKYACKDLKRGGDDDQSGGKKKGGWGFFTWFLIIAFLLAAAYIIFGSWLNYNRYGARGWDLVPHGDAIRDLPYIVKDLGSGMMSKLRGSGGSRGGYSAV